MYKNHIYITEENIAWQTVHSIWQIISDKIIFLFSNIKFCNLSLIFNVPKFIIETNDLKMRKQKQDIKSKNSSFPQKTEFKQIKVFHLNITFRKFVQK